MTSEQPETLRAHMTKYLNSAEAVRTASAVVGQPGVIQITFQRYQHVTISAHQQAFPLLTAMFIVIQESTQPL